MLCGTARKGEVRVQGGILLRFLFLGDEVRLAGAARSGEVQVERCYRISFKISAEVLGLLENCEEPIFTEVYTSESMYRFGASYSTEQTMEQIFQYSLMHAEQTDTEYGEGAPVHSNLQFLQLH